MLLTSGKAQGHSHLITSRSGVKTPTFFLFKVILVSSLALKCPEPRCFNSPESSVDASNEEVEGEEGATMCCVSFGTVLDLSEPYKRTPCPGDFWSSIHH